MTRRRTSGLFLAGKLKCQSAELLGPLQWGERTMAVNRAALEGHSHRRLGSTPRARQGQPAPPRGAMTRSGREAVEAFQNGAFITTALSWKV